MSEISAALNAMSISDFPPLVPTPVVSSDKVVSSDVKSVSDVKSLSDLTNKVELLMKQSAIMEEFTLIWCTRDLCVTAGEIWKWSVGRRGGGETGNGELLWRPDVQIFLTRAAAAMKMSKDVAGMKEISRTCILARNEAEAAHISTIKELDAAVLNSLKAIASFPQLEQTHANQCYTIRKYARLKSHLSMNFQ